MSVKHLELTGESVVTSTHNRLAWQLSCLISLNFRSSQWLVSGERNDTSQVCSYIITCWQNSSEKVTSCQVLCFHPCSFSHLPPLLRTSFSPLSFPHQWSLARFGMRLKWTRQSQTPFPKTKRSSGGPCWGGGAKTETTQRTLPNFNPTAIGHFVFNFVQFLALFFVMMCLTWPEQPHPVHSEKVIDL